MSGIPIANPEIGRTELERIEQVVANGQLADGPEVRTFEEEFAAYCETDRAIATSSGTTALHTALHAVGVGPGDRVITSPFSFVATANAIRLLGATPIFADVDPDTFNLDPDAVQETIEAYNGEVTALLPVHLYGLPADMGPLTTIADRYDLAVVEDAAQAHGAEYRGRPVGTFGDAACFSFYPTKNMTTGEGGMVVTDQERVATTARRFVNHGRSEETGRGYDHAEVGHNFRMTSIAAAIGRGQLDRLPAFNRARRENAAVLAETLGDLPAVTVPHEPSDRRHVYHQFTIEYADRNSLKTRLADRGIGSAVYYPRPIHQQPAYDRVDRSFPTAERASRTVLSLPVHPSVTPDDALQIANTVRDLTAVTGGVASD